MLRFSLVLAAGLGLAAPVSAASWADPLFSQHHKDFGPVPHGKLMVHSFRLTNRTGQAVHIAGVRVSCGCVSASARRLDLAPGQSTVVRAQMDTSRFFGHRRVTVF